MQETTLTLFFIDSSGGETLTCDLLSLKSPEDSRNFCCEKK